MYRERSEFRCPHCLKRQTRSELTPRPFAAGSPRSSRICGLTQQGKSAQHSKNPPATPTVGKSVSVFARQGEARIQAPNAGLTSWKRATRAYAGTREFFGFCGRLSATYKSVQHSKNASPTTGLARKIRMFWRGRAKPAFKRQNAGTPCRNRTYNCPLGGGCYIHLTKEACSTFNSITFFVREIKWCGRLF